MSRLVRAAAGAFVLWFASCAGATTITLETVANSTTTPPGSSLPFSGFGVSTPSINNGHIAFRGQTLGQNSGIYRDSGSGLQLIADRNTVNPGPIGPANTLSIFGNASVDASGNVAFRSSVASSGTTAIYVGDGGVLDQRISRDQPVPGLPGQIFLGFSTPQLDDDLVTVDGTIGPSGSGGAFNIIRETPTTIERLASLGQTLPGGTQGFSLFGSPVTENGNTAFAGFGTPGLGQQSGVFSDASGSLQPVMISGTTLIPGTSDPFGFIGLQEVGVDRDGEDVVFVGYSADFLTSGIYGLIDGTLTTLVDSNTLLPGSTTETFNAGGFTGLGYDNGNLLFVGADSSFNRGLYALYEGVLIEIASGGDTVGGVDSVFNFGLSQVDQSISGNQFTFLAQGNQGVEVVRGTFGDPIPEPATCVLFGAGFLACVTSQRRQKA